MKTKKEKYGLMTYPATPKYNVGDYIQSLAAKQYLPKVDEFIEREKLKDYNGSKVKMIMNGWYIQNPEQIRASLKIKPLYVSFHLNSYVKNSVLGDPRNIDFLRKNSPIGCRDYYTLNILKEHDIDAYYSGCLTTTLDLKYVSKKRTEDIYFADPLWILPHWEKLLYGKRIFIKGVLKGEFFKFGKRKEVLNSLFSDEIINSAIPIKHKLSGSHSESKRFLEAEKVLNKLASAKLVVTSRIHAALPCLALNTPVIFINYGFENASDQSRFKGITDLFNTININEKGEISANFEIPQDRKIEISDIIENPKKYLINANKLKRDCFEFIEN